MSLGGYYALRRRDATSTVAVFGGKSVRGVRASVARKNCDATNGLPLRC